MNERLNPSTPTNRASSQESGVSLSLSTTPSSTLSQSSITSLDQTPLTPLQIPPQINEEALGKLRTLVTQTFLNILAEVFTDRQALQEKTSLKNPLLRFTKQPYAPTEEVEKKLRQLLDDLSRLDKWCATTEKDIETVLNHTPKAPSKLNITSIAAPTTHTSPYTEYVKATNPSTSQTPDTIDAPLNPLAAITPPCTNLKDLQERIHEQFLAIRLKILGARKEIETHHGEFGYTLSSPHAGEKLMCLLEELKKLNKWSTVLRAQVEKTLGETETETPRSQKPEVVPAEEIKLPLEPPATKPTFFKRILAFLTKPT